MSEHKPDSEADETLLRREPNNEKTSVKAGSQDPSQDLAQGLSQGNGKLGLDDSASPATIIRSDSEEPAVESPSNGASSSNATILREPAVREPETKPASATILREPSGEGSQATILRSGDELKNAPPDAATILRNGSGEESDDDRTIINTPDDDDSTVIGHGVGGVDTTYIADVGPQNPRGNSEAGRLLKNRFVLEEKIGSGGMGDVYKALDLRQQEAKERNPYIAIKILNESFARHKDAFISLQRETTRTRGIPHPNIMAVYDFDKEGDTVFMSMELLDGKPLDDFLKDHPEGVSLEDAWNIIDGICQGLGRAHDAGIVHSDFKPGNIYYTTEKACKVFDFGIARAVSNPGDLVADGEKTVFDAGSLGALTPAYASYEMLKGLEPTKSDDIYAVALVAYELFTGKHPYNRVAADKALERGIVPEPPPFMKRRHWKVLKKALEIKGENRTQSMDEFREGMFSEDPPYFRYAAIAMILIASITFGAYQQIYGGAKALPEGFVEYEAGFQGAGANIGDRLKSPSFQSDDWHDQVASGVARLRGFDLQLSEEYPELAADQSEVRASSIKSRQNAVMDSYLDEIKNLRDQALTTVVDTGDRALVESAVGLLERASNLIVIVKEKFNFDASKVNSEERELASLKNLRDFQFETILNKEVADAEFEAARIAAAEAAAQAVEEERLRNESYVANLDEFRSILRCKGDIEDVEVFGPKGLEGVIANLERIYPARFAIDKPGLVAALSGCITQRVAVRAPARARAIKTAVMTYLPGESALAAIKISDLDPCAAKGLEGQGSRNRSWCEDQLAVGGTGPQLVVIPAKTGVKEEEPLGAPYALSRIEVRIGDFNQYCEDVGCQKLPGPSALPATNISLEQAQTYAAWLSDQSGKSYRIPTVVEWLYAATTNGTAEVDENVNCSVDSRGVRLGEKLLNTLSGRPNNWGLYNHVGNAREWAMQGEDVLALGGAHTDAKAECTLSKSVAHSGQADSVTGFRILRQI
ncbi:MAG: serine/threonine protein kinase [Candidatus Azotimanducaceae bacterium]|jgi:serine/threonine protein kinase